MEIAYSGQFKKEDFLTSQKIHLQPSPTMRKFRIGFIAIIIISYIAYFFLHPIKNLIDEVGVLLPVLLMVAVVADPLYRPYFQVSNYMKDPELASDISGAISESGIKIITSRSTIENKWELYERSIIKEDFVMLYNLNLYNLFPRRFFSKDEDWFEFLSLVKQNVPERLSKK